MFKNFFSLLPLYFRQDAQQAIHRFVYYLRKLPLIGKKIPQSLHKLGQVHLVLTIYKVILTLIKKPIKMLFFTAFFYVIPIFGTVEMLDLSLETSLIFAFIGVSILGQYLLKTKFFSSAEKEDYQMLLIFRVPERKYFDFALLYDLLNTYLDFIPLVIAALIFTEIGIARILLLLITYGAFRIFFASLGAKRRESGLRTLSKAKSRITWTFVGIFLVPCIFFAYIIASAMPNVANRLAALPALAIFGAASVLLAVFGLFLWKRIDFYKVKRDFLDIQGYMSDPLAKESSINLEANKIQKKSYIDDVPEKVTMGKSGLRYAHALFFYRFKASFIRSNLIMFFVSLAVLVLTVSLSLLTDSRAPSDLDILDTLIPAVFLFAYFFSSGQSYTGKLFANMDRYLLPYSFYRREDLVVEGLKIRFGHFFMLSLPSMIVQVLILLINGFIHFPAAKDRVIIVVVFYLIELIFFKFYHLIIYYAFQPYNANMEVKSVPIQISNVAFSAITIFIMNMESLDMRFYLIMAILQMAFLVLSLLFVKKLAVKNFKLRQ